MVVCEAERNQLIEDNVGIVKFIIKKYYPTVYGELFDEFVSLGWCALCKAARTYDSSKGSFTNWASRYIRKEIAHNYRLQFAQKRIPKEQIVSMNMEFGDGFTLERVLSKDVLSLDDHFTLLGFHDYLKTVCPRQKKIVELYFGLNGEVDHPQAEIAQRFKLSQVQISRIITKVLDGFRQIW
jgi:RNA polymerase sporulation-specific sigma factor